MRPLLTVLRRHRDLRLLVAANQVSVIGDYLLNVGLMFFVYDLTGSTLASGGTLLAGFLPSILLGSVAGVYVDRWDRRRTMVVSQVLMALVLLPLLLVDAPGDVWIVYAVIAAEGVLEQFWFPAEQAMLPHLVPDEDLVVANALNNQVQQVGRLVGSGAGGVAIGLGGLPLLAALDGLTFAVSLLLLVRIRSTGRAERGPGTGPALRSGVVREWADGIRYASSRRVLAVVLVWVALAMCGEGFMGTLFVPFVQDVLEGDAEIFGLIVGVQAIGGIAGGFVAASLARRMTPALMFGAGSLLFGLIDLSLFLYPLWYVAVWPAVVLIIVVGVPGAVLNAGRATLVQQETDDAYRGRVFGALNAVGGVAIVLGTVVAGLLGEVVGIIPVLSMQGVFGVVAGAVVLVVLRADLRRGTPAAAATPGPGSEEAASP